MEVTMMLCDAAAVADGKLYIHGGGWTHLWAPNTPANMALAILIAIPWDRTNQRNTVRAALINDDGEPVEVEGQEVFAEGQVEVGRPAGLKAGSTLNVPLTLSFNGLSLDAGGYVWELRIDGDEKARVPFRVELPPG
jgi:hypothetical protein